MTTKSAGNLDKSGGSVAHPFEASIKTIHLPLTQQNRLYNQLL